MSRMEHRVVQATIAVVAALVVLLTACSSQDDSGDRGRELRNAGRSVVPPDGRVLAEVTDNWVELATPPTCFLTIFALDQPRARAGRTA